MRDLALRLLQMLGDGAAEADDRHLLDPVAAGEDRRSRGRRLNAGGDIGVEILMGDASARPGPSDELQFDAEVPGAPPDRRRRQRLRPETAGRGHLAGTLTRPPAGLRPRLGSLSRDAGEGYDLGPKAIDPL